MVCHLLEDQVEFHLGLLVVDLKRVIHLVDLLLGSPVASPLDHLVVNPKEATLPADLLVDPKEHIHQVAFLPDLLEVGLKQIFHLVDPLQDFLLDHLAVGHK
jgi:hypothetical protein